MDQFLTFIPIDRQIALVDFSPLRTQTHGAALFADLSGFTPLTEALVRALGQQRGAEELTHQLNRVYDALIGQVENFRGTVIGFSGDAITCWFDRDDGTHAIACAKAMQNEMQQFAAVPIPNGGTVALALKAAVVQGPARRFAVGDPEIQLIDVLAGSTLDRLAETEHQAEKGEVVVDALTAQALADKIDFASWKEHHGNRCSVVRALRVPVKPEPWSRPGRGELSDEEIKPWILPQVYARLETGQASFLAELRPAVSLFERFGGIDFEQDPEAAAKLDLYIRWVQSIINKYDGILVQLTIGDKGSYFYAAFGAPVAHDDDTVRAVRAARELQAPPPEFKYITAPQIGISRGRMRVGTYGGSTRRTYGVLGDEVNVAARLMQAAQPGQILVTDRVLSATERIFEFERLPLLQVKGKSEPLRVSALRGERAETAYAFEELYSLPIVGRTQELESIRDCVERATNGQGQVLIFVGEAGVGKSRLAAEAIRLARRAGFEEFASECPSHGTENSYIAFHAIWRSYFGIDKNADIESQNQHLTKQLQKINPNFEMRVPLLSTALNLSLPENDLTRSLDGRVRKQLLEGLLTDCLRVSSLDAPLVFLLEDCHWIDALSHDLLEVLARETADRPVLFVITMRPPDLERLQAPRLTAMSHTTVISLADFTQEEATRLIQLKVNQFYDSDQPIDPAIVERLTARAGGNPFYIEELLNYTRDRGLDIRQVHSAEELDLPDSLSSLILSRIDRLKESQRAVLKVASIIGRQFPFRWLWGVFPELGKSPLVRADLDITDHLDLTELDQPDPNRAYFFRHAMTHQVTYESQPYATRAEMHAHLGMYLEREFAQDIDSVVDLLAHHFDRSEQLTKRRQYLLRAGELAQAEYANDAAINYYRRVLPIVPETERIAVMLKLGQVYEVVGQWDAERDLYREALELATRLGDAHADAQVRAAFGVLARKRGEFADAAQWLDDARQGFENLNDRAGIGQVLHERGTLAASQGKLDDARAFYQASLEIRRALGDKRMIASLLSNLGILARMQGDYAAAGELYAESLELRRETSDRMGIAVSLNNLGVLYRYQGNYPQARAILQESLALWREIGDRSYLANTLTSLSEVLIDQGDADGARVYLVESMEITRALGDKRAIAFLLENFARVALLQMDGERALRLISAAAALRANIGAPLPQAEQKSMEERLQTASGFVSTKDATRFQEEGQNLSMQAAIEYAMKH